MSTEKYEIEVLENHYGVGRLNLDYKLRGTKVNGDFDLNSLVRAGLKIEPGDKLIVTIEVLKGQGEVPKTAQHHQLTFHTFYGQHTAKCSCGGWELDYMFMFDDLSLRNHLRSDHYSHVLDEHEKRNKGDSSVTS